MWGGDPLRTNICAIDSGATPLRGLAPKEDKGGDNGQTDCAPPAFSQRHNSVEAETGARVGSGGADPGSWGGIRGHTAHFKLRPSSARRTRRAGEPGGVRAGPGQPPIPPPPHTRRHRGGGRPDGWPALMGRPIGPAGGTEGPGADGQRRAPPPWRAPWGERRTMTMGDSQSDEVHGRHAGNARAGRAAWGDRRRGRKGES